MCLFILFSFVDKILIIKVKITQLTCHIVVVLLISSAVCLCSLLFNSALTGQTKKKVHHQLHLSHHHCLTWTLNPSDTGVCHLWSLACRDAECGCCGLDQPATRTSATLDTNVSHGIFRWSLRRQKQQQQSEHTGSGNSLISLSCNRNKNSLSLQLLELLNNDH